MPATETLAAAAAVPARGSAATGPVLATATTAMGLMSGLFFAFDVSVMPGLAAGDDRTYVTAMQHINAAITNPVFAAVRAAFAPTWTTANIARTVLCTAALAALTRTLLVHRRPAAR
ncbi:hypothetical protein [Kitasatospora sp. NPDC001527]|uniref:hypothetical protein n=1 Tax=Kitasatospora sp. NPDC001527 TaxID=3154519 RepID=UPI003320AD6D